MKRRSIILGLVLSLIAAPLVALSGPLAWLAFAAPAANLAGVLARRARGGAPPSGARAE